jgi:hypothetical protein
MVGIQIHFQVKYFYAVRDGISMNWDGSDWTATSGLMRDLAESQRSRSLTSSRFQNDRPGADQNELNPYQKVDHTGLSF